MRVATASLYMRSTFTRSSPDNDIRGNTLVRAEIQPVQPHIRDSRAISSTPPKITKRSQNAE